MEATQDILNAKQLHARLLRKKLASVKANGLAYYKPHPKQVAFHEAGALYNRRMMRAGNRSGKSTCGCAEDVSWLVGERSWYPVDHPMRTAGLPRHKVKLLTITTDWDLVDTIFTSQRGDSGKAWKFIPSGALAERNPVRRNHSGAIDTIEFRNGSLWRFDTVKSFKSEPQSSESADWDAIHVDEPIPEDMWKANARGLIDRGGSAWFTLTPLREPWISDKFFTNETNSDIRPDHYAVQASIYDNPYLTAKAIADYEADLTEDEKQCRLYGLPLHLSGLIYKEFKWDVHVLKDLPLGWTAFNKPPTSWPVYVNIDPHPQTPHAVLFCSVAPSGARFYFYEFFVHCSIEALVKGTGDGAIQGILPFLKGYKIAWTKMDPLGFINDPITETSIATEAEGHGLPCEKATKALAEGILYAQGELKKRDSEGRPVLYVSPSCRRFLWEIQRYCWDEKENKPVDKDDHMMENFYRNELSRPRWFPVEPQPFNITDEVIEKPRFDLEDLEFTE